MGREVMMAGEIRLNLNNQRLVTLVGLDYDVDRGANPDEHTLWETRDCLDGSMFLLHQRDLGSRVFCAMEVLAWAAST